MFAGHVGVALAAKVAEPRAPLGALVAATFGLDLLWPIFLVTGIESVSVSPGATAFTPLAFDSYPWSHSLAMVLGWGALGWGLMRWFGGTRGAATVIGAVVVSHWFLDFITHDPDLPLWPGGPEVGLGLWNSVPGTLAVEGAIFLGAIILYSRAFPARDWKGRVAFGSLVGFVTLIWVSGPFSPPPPSATAVAVVGFALWVFPFWAWWVERGRVPARGPSPPGGG